MSQHTSVEGDVSPEKERGNPLQVLSEQIEALSSPLEKLRTAIDFMRDALAQSGTPFFKGFWEARRICLPLFKESLPAHHRTELWGEYIELTQEGRRLKNLLDQETAFAVEQIDIAIKSLEESIEALKNPSTEILTKSGSIEFPEHPKALSSRMDSYREKQQRLNLLNSFAVQINALRKELIKTEMRIRIKNQLFKRLSHLGDEVFPPRKELIRQVSVDFTEDVATFVEENFSHENFSHEEARRSVFFFREEIKRLQTFAKLLTLNTHAFSTTREQLSSCWDKLRGMEKELKKESAEQRQQSSENKEKVLAKIQEISADYQEEKISYEIGLKHFRDLLVWMRKLELTRSDVHTLKEAVGQAKKPMESTQALIEESRREKAHALQTKKREEMEAFKNQLSALKEKIASEDVGTLQATLEECKKQLAELSLSKAEKLRLEGDLKNLRDQIIEKQEKALLALPEGDRAALDQLEGVLQERKKRRQEIKLQIEGYRKILGGSSLDFEKAMEYNELMAVEKEKLEKADQGIGEIELKMQELKKQGESLGL